MSGGAPREPGAERIGRIFREESGRSVAALIGRFGDVQLAEDAVQDAFERALANWGEQGLPENPGGWITRVAANCAVDRLRRSRRGRELIEEAGIVLSSEWEDDGGDVEHSPDWMSDERLELFFMCCHPALSPETQVALTLKLLGGLSTEEVARAFLVGEETMAQRLVRAKRKIRQARIPFRIPRASELPNRLSAVLGALYLIYSAGAKPGVEGEELRAEAVRLVRLLDRVMAGEPEVEALLALLLFTESRTPARWDADGGVIPLDRQDRERWDGDRAAEAAAIHERLEGLPEPGPYQLQAAIAAVHCGTGTIEETDWPRIVALYDRLYALLPTPVVALNRAIAVAEVDGPEVGIDLVGQLEISDDYYLLHATRADLLRRLGREEEAGRAYARAAELAPTAAERSFLAAGGRGA